MTIGVGEFAPEIELLDQTEHVVKLSDYADRANVVIVFFRFAFSGFAHIELQELSAHLGQFEEASAQLLAISCDTPYVNEKFAAEYHLAFPLLSDFWPHGKAANSFDVFDPRVGCADNTTFYINKSGQIARVLCNDASQSRSIDQHIEALKVFNE